jgi:hypothetical protein
MNRPAFLALLILCAASLASGLGRDEKKAAPKQTPENESLNGGRADGANEDAPQNRPVRVSGRVRLVGTAVFPELVISGEDREWYISKDEQSLLLEFQQRVVTVEGTESYVDLTFANGLPAGRRYTLKNIRLVSAGESQ